MKKILFINPFGIGDVLFTTPLITNIKQKYPDLFIGYWCNERVASVLIHNSNIDKVFPLSRGDIKKTFKRSKWEGSFKTFKLLNALRKEKFDTCLDFSLDHRYGIVSILSGISRRFGYDYKNRGRFLTGKIPLESYSQKHVIEYYLELLKFIDLSPSVFKMELVVSGKGELEARDLLEEIGVKDWDRLILIAPGAGASWGMDASIKHWPAENFAQLADKLIHELNVKVVLIGDSSEKIIADKVIGNMHNKAINLVGKTSLDTLLGIIKAGSLIICNDGGPLHIAVALNIKTVSLFGPVDAGVYGPYPPDDLNNIVLRNAIDCSPCYRNFKLNPCKKNKQCLEDISVEQVFEAVKKLL